ncbi:MAG: hypothetical protein NWP69_09070 [Congregibacter sp.]|nr:hypothetical protein [Congregibacter sp.]
MLDEHQRLLRIARTVGWSQLVQIALGILTSLLVAKGIDINLSADIESTARNMLDAEIRLRAKAYLGCFGHDLRVMRCAGRACFARSGRRGFSAGQSGR